MKEHYLEGPQIRCHGLASQCHLNTPAAFHCVNKKIYSKKKKILRPTALYFNKESKKAIKSVANLTKRNKKRFVFQIPVFYFGHHLAPCKLKYDVFGFQDF